MKDAVVGEGGVVGNVLLLFFGLGCARDAQVSASFELW